MSILDKIKDAKVIFILVSVLIALWMVYKIVTSIIDSTNRTAAEQNVAVAVQAKADLENATKALNEATKATEQLIEKVKADEELREKQKEIIESKDSILKDIKLTPKVKESIYDTLTLKIDTDKEGNPLNELSKWRKDSGLEGEIILATIYQMTNKFKNLGKIMEISKSRASQQLEEKLRDSAEKRKDVPIKLGNGTFELDV